MPPEETKLFNVVFNFSHIIILRCLLTDNAHDDKDWNFECSEAGILHT